VVGKGKAVDEPATGRANRTSTLDAVMDGVGKLTSRTPVGWQGVRLFVRHMAVLLYQMRRPKEAGGCCGRRCHLTCTCKAVEYIFGRCLFHQKTL
jgi:hypothetical protein